MTTPLDPITTWLAPLSGKHLVEIGCGKAALCAPLQAQGAIWTGVDPQTATDNQAIIRAGAENMPFAAEQFDAAIYVNALHHVPVALMDQALRETWRILRPQGHLIVIEPQAEGELSRVLAVIDDETEIRTAAQSALDAAVAQGLFREPDRLIYERTELYQDFARFCTVAAQVDPARTPRIAAYQTELSTCFHAIAEATGVGFALRQPMIARLLQRC